LGSARAAVSPIAYAACWLSHGSVVDSLGSTRPAVSPSCIDHQSRRLSTEDEPKTEPKKAAVPALPAQQPYAELITLRAFLFAPSPHPLQARIPYKPAHIDTHARTRTHARTHTHTRTHTLTHHAHEGNAEPQPVKYMLPSNPQSRPKTFDCKGPI
jgi:hypothetical protein